MSQSNIDARAFNEWLQNRHLKRQGEEDADVMGRMAETARSGGKCSEPHSSWPRASRQNMEGEPSFSIPLPNRNASIYRSSHFYLDEFPQSTEPLAENPRPH